MRILNNTTSLCPTCLKKIPAEIFLKKGQVNMRKDCPEHGHFESFHIWNDPVIYRGMVSLKTVNAPAAKLSIELTNRCNLNCPICYARANEDEDPREFPIKDIPKAGGCKTVILSGGEPTIRQDLPKIIYRLTKAGKKVIMYSNGIKFTDPVYVRKLKRAGLKNVIIQFDSLDDSDYLSLRGRKLVSIKKQAVANLNRCRLKTHLLAVITRKNLNQIEKILRFAKRYSMVRNVSFNELWKWGRFREKDYVPSSEIVAAVSKALGITRQDWLKATKFYFQMDRFLNLFSRQRHFSKCNLKYLAFWPRPVSISIATFFTPANIDFSLVNECNQIAVAKDDFTFGPSCLHRIEIIKKMKVHE